MKCISPILYPNLPCDAPLSLVMNQSVVAEMCKSPMPPKKMKRFPKRASECGKSGERMGHRKEETKQRLSAKNCKAGNAQAPQYIAREDLVGISAPSCRRPTCRRSERLDPRMKYRCSSFWCIRTSWSSCVGRM